MNHSALESDLRELLDGQARAVQVSDPPPIDHLRSAGGTRSAPPRAGRLLLMAAAIALFVGGLAAIVASRDPVPASSTEPAPSPTTVPTSGIDQPDALPALPTSDPRNGETSGTYGMRQTAPGSAALVARIDGDTMTEGISIRVSDAASLASGDSGEPVTIEGTTYQIYREQGTPVITTVVLPGSPAVSLTGIDPVAYIRAAGTTTVENAVIDASGVATFSIGQLPDGYEVIVDAQQQSTPTIAPQINLRGPANGDGSFVEVSVNNPLVGMATVGTWRRVEVNGSPGWIDSDPAFVVVWPTTEGSWATAMSSSTAADAIELAETVEFIDEAEWRSRYRVETPRFDGYIDPLETRSPSSEQGAALPSTVSTDTPTTVEPTASELPNEPDPSPWAPPGEEFRLEDLGPIDNLDTDSVALSALTRRISLEDHPALRISTSIEYFSGSSIEEQRCLFVQGGGGSCSPTDLADRPYISVTSSVDNRIADFDLWTWGNVPPGADYVVYDPDGDARWQRPISGVAAFPNIDWFDSTAVAYTDEGVEVGRVDRAVIEAAQQQQPAEQPLIADLEKSQGSEVQDVMNNTMIDCLTAAGADFEGSIAELTAGDPNEIWAQCVAASNAAVEEWLEENGIQFYDPNTDTPDADEPYLDFFVEVEVAD